MKATLILREQEKHTAHLYSVLYIMGYAAKSGWRLGWTNSFSSPVTHQPCLGAREGQKKKDHLCQEMSGTTVRGRLLICRSTGFLRCKTEVTIIVLALLMLPTMLRKFLSNYESHHKCWMLPSFLGQCLAHSKCLVSTHWMNVSSLFVHLLPSQDL